MNDDRLTTHTHIVHTHKRTHTRTYSHTRARRHTYTQYSKWNWDPDNYVTWAANR